MQELSKYTPTEPTATMKYVFTIKPRIAKFDFRDLNISPRTAPPEKAMRPIATELDRELNAPEQIEERMKPSITGRNAIKNKVLLKKIPGE